MYCSFKNLTISPCLKKSLSLQHKLINIFGNDTTNGGKLVLSKLASVAFKDKINQQLLNGIMWPEILLLIDKAIEKQKNKKVNLFIVDAALIFEGNLNNILDGVLLIKTKDELRKRRAIKRHNISLVEIESYSPAEPRFRQIHACQSIDASQA